MNIAVWMLLSRDSDEHCSMDATVTLLYVG